MSQYITLNADGTELKREDKGRGRPRSDAIQRTDGNWYIQLGKSVVTAIANDEVVKQPTVTIQSNGKPMADIKPLAGSKIPLQNFLGSFHITPMDMQKTETEINARGVIFNGNDKIPGLAPYAIYGRLNINLTTGTAKIHSDWMGSPRVVIENAVEV